MSSISNMQAVLAPGSIKHQGVETAWAGTATVRDILKTWPNLRIFVMQEVFSLFWGEKKNNQTTKQNPDSCVFFLPISHWATLPSENNLHAHLWYLASFILGCVTPFCHREAVWDDSNITKLLCPFNLPSQIFSLFGYLWLRFPLFLLWGP